MCFRLATHGRRPLELAAHDTRVVHRNTFWHVYTFGIACMSRDVRSRIRRTVYCGQGDLKVAFTNFAHAPVHIICAEGGCSVVSTAPITTTTPTATPTAAPAVPNAAANSNVAAQADTVAAPVPSESSAVRSQAHAVTVLVALCTAAVLVLLL